MQLISGGMAGKVAPAREARAWLTTFGDQDAANQANRPDAEKHRALLKRLLARAQGMRASTEQVLREDSPLPPETEVSDGDIGG